MQPDLLKIQAIIFDLGGVIIDLDESATHRAFSEISKLPLADIQQMVSRPYFKKYEVGAIDDPTFRAHLREDLQFEGPDALIDEAWNAMLGPITKERLEKLEALAKSFRLFVMSNTNSMHVRRFIKIAAHVSPEKPFDAYFEEVYFSHEVEARKPNPEAWQPIFNDNGLSPHQALFIDDKLENVEAASAMGMQVLHNPEINYWLSVLN